MDDESLRLAELMCTRLCHDLSGPIGGAAAGVELLEDEAGGLPPEVAGLLGASVHAASRHLRFLRAAFGQGGPPTDPGELRALAEGFLGGGGGDNAPRLDWQDDGAADAAWTRGHGKLVLNMVCAGRDALALGGTLAVDIRRAAPWRVTVSARGRMSAAAEEVLAGLAAQTAEGLSPRSAQACFARRLAAALGATLTGRRDEQGLLLIAQA